MSLWGATVITSLASALPVVGTSIVGWLWGGFSVKYDWQLDFLMFQNRENFACCGNNFFMDGYSFLEEWFILFYMIKPVKIPSIHSQSADVWGVRLKSATPASQRLNAEEQAWLVGFYEADGWFGVFKNGKYLQYEFGIELNKVDEPLLHQIKNKYKLSGKVRIRKDRPNIVVFKVRNKKDLMTKIVPIFDKFPMLGLKNHQYLFFRYHLIERRAIYSIHLEISKVFETIKKNPKTLVQVPYFDSWLVGFINGEGCFSIYTPKGSLYPVCSYSIRQKLDGFLLLSAVRERLKLKTNVLLESTGCYHLKTTSVTGCSQALSFLHTAPVKLKGNKRIQYIQWAKQMRVNPKYQKIRVPNKLSKDLFQILTILLYSLNRVSSSLNLTYRFSLVHDIVRTFQ